MQDTRSPWLIPVVVILAVIVILILVMICLWAVREKKSDLDYIKGEESPTLKATSAPKYSPQPHHQSTIDGDTVVKITSSRTDSFEAPQHCPTASVVVTPLRKVTPFLEDEDFDDGYYGDGYMSNSMPPEGHLAASGLQELSVAQGPIAISSPQGFGDYNLDSHGFMDPYNSFPRSIGSRIHEELSTSYDSMESAEVGLLPRNISSGSLPLDNKPLSRPALEVNQFWV